MLFCDRLFVPLLSALFRHTIVTQRRVRGLGNSHSQHPRFLTTMLEVLFWLRDSFVSFPFVLLYIRFLFLHFQTDQLRVKEEVTGEKSFLFSSSAPSIVGGEVSLKNIQDMGTPHYDSGSPEPPSLRVQRLESPGAAESSSSVVCVKLTDEIFAALMNASRKNSGKLQVKVDSKGGTFDLGSLGIFHFQSQLLNGETDTISEDSASHKFRMNGSFKTKYQIQATDKSFAETKEKAQKLMEEEKSRGTKEATSRLSKNLVPRIGSASSSRHSSPFLTRNDPNSKISPNKFSNTTGTNGTLNNGSTRQNVNPLAGELRKKKLRTRIVHLIVTGKFSSVDEISHHLRREGVNEEEGWVKKVEEIVHDVAEFGSPRNKLTLKPSCYPEIDQRWPWFTREEKDAVRRLKDGSSGTKEAFAPMRKKGMERMQPRGHTNNVSPEAIPTPPASRPGSGDGGQTAKSKSISPPVQRTAAPPSPSIITDLLDYTSTTNTNKRTAHVPHTSVQPPTKRPRQESSSPPEDPTISLTNHTASTKTVERITAPRMPVPPKRTPKRSTGGGSSSASSRLSSPCSLSSPQNPSCDWEKKFPEIKSVSDAEKYFNVFHGDYHSYMEAFRHLQNTSLEFREYEKRLKKAGHNTKEIAEIEREVQNRYAQFEKNEVFLKHRQVHADLRSKLSVLKQRIMDWERSQDSHSIF